MMLSRRFLRIKTMQALYSYFKNEKPNSAAFEKELFKSIDNAYDLYLIILSVFGGIHQNALLIIDENKNKRLPTESDLNPNLKLTNNTLLIALSESKEIKDQIQSRRLGSIVEDNIIRRVLQEVKKSPEFAKYVESESNSVKADKLILISIVVNVLIEHEVLNSIFEDKNIYWADDLHAAYAAVIKNFEVFTGEFKLMPLYKDEADDMAFVSSLFNKTILHKEEYLELIQAHVKNWELDRIAEMDLLLMQMCITEFLYQPSVPIKASLNEYIDISKEYSTPSSKIFINGILDKIIIQLKAEKKIEKEGRGLKEN